MNNKLYIAGKISGEDYHDALAKFARYEYLYFNQEYNTVNPMRICRKEWSWLRCMAKCIWHLAKCKTVAFMPDWTLSRGARIEMAVAVILGKQIVLSQQL